MPVLNATTRELHCNIAYYGPALSGKLTNLRYIYDKASPAEKSRWATIVEPFPLVAFYFSPAGLPAIDGNRLCIHLSAIHGQVFYDEGRKKILRNIDGLVFVADAEVARLEATREHLENLHRHLAEQGRDPSSLPMVFQYNKCDLPDIVGPEELDELLNPRGLPTVRAVAATGAGVFDTLKTITKLLLLELRTGRLPQKPLVLLKAPDDPLRLWELFRSDVIDAK
jgi:hypothetical protein